MMMVVVAATLAFAPQAQARKALVSLDAEVLKASGLQARGLEVVDVSKEMARFHGDVLGGVVVPDEPAPAWATDALRKDWEQGAAGCRARIGPPPYAGNMKAIFCGQDLAKALWQRHLERLDPAGVVVGGGVREDPATKEFLVSIFGYRVDETVTRSFDAKAETRAEAVRLAADFVARIFDGGGQDAPRTVLRQLPEAPAGAPVAAAAARFKPVDVPAGCAAKLPRTLVLGSDQTSLDLDRLWTTSVTGGGAPGRPCALRYLTEAGDMGGTSMYTGVVSLACGDQSFEGKARGLLVSRVEELALQDLLAKVFAAWCK